MLKDLIAKYSEELNNETALNDVNVDMNPDMGVIEIITNADNEESVTKQIESAIADVEEIEETSKDADELEEALEEEVAEGEEVSAESAIKVVAAIDKFLVKHNMNSPEERASLDLPSDLTVESATDYPVTTRESAVASGKAFLAKIKEIVKTIIEKIIKIWKALKNNVLAMLGNNQAVVKKLLGAVQGLEDKDAEGKVLTNASIVGKFPFQKNINTKGSLQSVLKDANSAALLEKVIGEFVKGVASKNLEGFNKLSVVSKNVELEKEFAASAVVPLRLYGSSISGLVSVDGAVSVKTVTVKGDKAEGDAKTLTLADIKTILNDCNAYISAQKSLIEKIEGSFESLKGIKIEDEEFAKTAKIDSTINTLTKAKLTYVDASNGTIKNVLQIIALNMAVKAKKGEAKKEETK